MSKTFYIIGGVAVVVRVADRLALLRKDGTESPYTNLREVEQNGFRVTESQALAFLARQKGPEERNCGTGAGGFQPGNECSKGGAGTSPHYDALGEHPKVAGVKLSGVERINGIQVTRESMEKFLRFSEAVADMMGEDYDDSANGEQNLSDANALENMHPERQSATLAFQGSAYKPMLLAMQGAEVLQEQYHDNPDEIYDGANFQLMNAVAVNTPGELLVESWEDTKTFMLKDFADSIRGDYPDHLVSAVEQGDYNFIRNEDGSLHPLHDELWEREQEWKGKWFEDTAATFASAGKAVNEAASQTALDLPNASTVLFRGTSIPAAYSELRDPVGAFVEDLTTDGRMTLDLPHSTSKDPFAAASFLGQSSVPVMLVIEGANRGIDFNQLAPSTGLAKEQEVILPANDYAVKRVRVLDRKGADGKSYPQGIIVELLNKKDGIKRS